MWFVCFLCVLFDSCLSVCVLVFSLLVVWGMWFKDQMEDRMKESFLKPKTKYNMIEKFQFDSLFTNDF